MRMAVTAAARSRHVLVGQLRGERRLEMHGARHFEGRAEAERHHVDRGLVGQAEAEQRARLGGLRQHLHGDLGHHRERAPGAGNGLAEIVAGDVLHHAAAGFEGLAPAVHARARRADDRARRRPGCGGCRRGWWRTRRRSRTGRYACRARARGRWARRRAAGRARRGCCGCRRAGCRLRQTSRARSARRARCRRDARCSPPSPTGCSGRPRIWSRAPSPRAGSWRSPPRQRGRRSRADVSGAWKPRRRFPVTGARAPRAEKPWRG